MILKFQKPLINGMNTVLAQNKDQSFVNVITLTPEEDALLFNDENKEAYAECEVTNNKITIIKKVSNTEF